MNQYDAKRRVAKSLDRPVDLIDWTHMEYGVFVVVTEDKLIMPEASVKTIRATVFIEGEQASQSIVKTTSITE